MEFTFYLGFHAPTWLILALLTSAIGLVGAAMRGGGRSSRRLDQSEFTSLVEKEQMHQIHAPEKRN
jgi:hypothetical protein